MRKYDFYLIGGILLLAILLGSFQFLRRQERSSLAVVTQDGEQLGSYILSVDKELTFTDARGGRNVLQIKNGKACMSEADCPDKLCMRQKGISRTGESIICLPHRLVIEIKNGEDSNVDAVTG